MTQNGPNAATRVSGAIAIRAAIDVDGTLRVHRVPLKNRVASVQTVAAGGGEGASCGELSHPRDVAGVETGKRP